MSAIFFRKRINMYFYTPLSANNALVSMVSVSLLDLSEHFVEIIYKCVYNFSKISSTEYIRNIFNSESDCCHYLVHNPPNPPAMYCKTSNSLNNYTFMFKNRFIPHNVCIRSMQAKQLSLLFC